MTGNGPYASRAQALADAEPLRAAIRAADPGGPVTDEIRTARHAAAVTHIANRLHEAGVKIGAYDGDIIDWLVLWEPETIQVVLSWVERAHAAGRGEFDVAIAEANARIDALTTAARRAAPVEADLDSFRRLIDGSAR